MSDPQPPANHTKMASAITLSSTTAGNTYGSTLSQNGTDSSHLERNSEALRAEELLSTFTKFPKLPAELRLNVWNYACCVTRNLVLQIKDLRRDRWDGLTPYNFYTSCPMPAVLAVCQESRAEALQHYSLDFEVRGTWEWRMGQMTFDAPPTIYINWGFDRVCILKLESMEACSWAGEQVTERLKELQQRFLLKKLRYLACELETWDDLDQMYGCHHGDLLPSSRDNTHLVEVISFREVKNFHYSYEAHGMLEFGNISGNRKGSFDYAVDQLCETVHRACGDIKSSVPPPMPFDVRCAEVIFDKDGNNGKEAKTGTKKPSEEGNSAALVPKGEIWKYTYS